MFEPGSLVTSSTRWMRSLAGHALRPGIGWGLLVAILVAAASPGRAHADCGSVLGRVWDIASDFSNTQGQGDWSYGYTHNGGPFTLMTQYGVSNPDLWTSDASLPAPWYFTAIGRDYMHPNGLVTSGRTAADQEAVLRWTSPVSGPIRLSGHIRKQISSTSSNGVDWILRHNGAQIFTSTLAGTDVRGFDYGVDVTVAVGDVIDFVLNARGNNLADGVFYTAFVAAGSTWDVAADLSGVQGQDDWHYGYTQSGGPYTPLPTFSLAPTLGNAWSIDRSLPLPAYFTIIGANIMHPNGTATPSTFTRVDQEAILRWVSPFTGVARCLGHVRKWDASGGNGVDWIVRHNGIPVHSRFIAGTDGYGAHYDLSVPVTAGDAIDFVLNAHLSNDFADHTFYRALVQAVSIVDEVRPTLITPPDVSAATGPGAAGCGAVIDDALLGSATAVDDCPGPVTIVRSGVPPGNLFPVGTTIITYLATDHSGNTESTTQRVTVVDDTSPALTIPADVVVVTGPGPETCLDLRIPLETGAAAATDNCGDPALTVSGAPADGLFPVGETQLIWTATDDAGNASSGIQTVTVTCPVGDLAGSAALLCNGSAAPATGVTVHLLHEGTPFRSTTTGPTGEYRFEAVRLGTYTVDIDAPPGYAVTPDTRTETLAGAELTLEPFVFTCLLSDLTGQVLGTCNGQTAGLQGVTVDVYGEDSEGMDVLIATTGTDASGAYRFDDLALGDYTLGIVLPLGYTTGMASQTATLATPDGSLAAEPFTLTCQVIAAEPRSMGYWKHQVNVYLTGKGRAQETLADLLHFIDELVIHFNENLVNPVIVYVPGSSQTNDKLLQLQQLLTVNRGGTMLDRAKQQLLALLLNVVSGKISQTEVISDDGATVAQAITHSHDLIVDGLTSTDETAKTICEIINNGQRVPSGMVPTNTRLITYDRRPGPPEPARPTELALGPIAPNPATLDATLTFALPGDAQAVLEIHDPAGRLVARHQVGSRGAGIHTFRLAEVARLRPGIYLVRLLQAGVVRSLRLAVLR